MSLDDQTDTLGPVDQARETEPYDAQVGCASVRSRAPTKKQERKRYADPSEQPRLLHPLETLARRPARHPPRWKPKPRDATGVPSRSAREGWHSPRILADSDGAAIAIDFKYCHPSGATASYSDKARRQQYMSGPHEAARWRLLETSAHVIEFLFHPFTIVWQTRDGEDRGYTPDTLELRTDGLFAVEVKACETFFDDPDVADVLGQAERFLSTVGVTLERWSGADEELERRTCKAVADCRRFDFTVEDAAAVDAMLARGPATVADLVAAIPGRPRERAAKLRAMAARGRVSIDMRRPWMPWTAASKPDAQQPSPTIRDFLLHHASTPDQTA